MDADSIIQLDQLLTPSTILLHAQIGDPMQVIQKAGELLLANGGIEERYITAMQESLITNGPYMVIVPGVALLHARPEDGVKKVCMSLITLDPPVPFGSEYNDPVTLAIALGAVDDTKHQEALMALAVLLQDEAGLARLRSSDSIEEVCAILASAPRANFTQRRTPTASEEHA